MTTLGSISSQVRGCANISEMNKDKPRTVLRNISEAALFGWRTDLPAPPEIAQESWIATKYGEAIVRLYRAKKGSSSSKTKGPASKGARRLTMMLSMSTSQASSRDKEP